MYTMERQLNAESVEPKQRIRDSKLGRRGDVKTLKYFSLVVLQKKKKTFSSPLIRCRHDKVCQTIAIDRSSSWPSRLRISLSLRDALPLLLKRATPLPPVSSFRCKTAAVVDERASVSRNSCSFFFFFPLRARYVSIPVIFRREAGSRVLFPLTGASSLRDRSYGSEDFN